MNGDADFLLERLDESLGGVRLAQPGHVLDAQNIGARFFQRVRQLDIVFQAVLGPFFVKDVAGVADGRLAKHPLFADRVNRQTHVREPVERVENSE